MTEAATAFRPRGARGMAITDERKALIKKCLDDGWSWTQIMQTHGVGYRTLARHFPGTQMDLTDAAKLGNVARKTALALRKQGWERVGLSVDPTTKAEA